MNRFIDEHSRCLSHRTNPISLPLSLFVAVVVLVVVMIVVCFEIKFQLISLSRRHCLSKMIFFLETTMMLYLNRYQTLFRQICTTLLCNQRYLRNGPQAPPSILDSHANLYRPEVESDLEYLAVQTSRKPSLQINYELE
jgi:hypothetical protein